MLDRSFPLVPSPIPVLVRRGGLWLTLLLVVASGAGPQQRDEPKAAPENTAVRPPDIKRGARYRPERTALKAPRIEALPLPAVPRSRAIWGATGRDDAGRIYIGVSCYPGPGSSAALLRVNQGGGATVIGNVLAEQRRTIDALPAEGQNKIHSKICQADDGYIYFASLDEQGEKSDGSVGPTWGGHLWRQKPDESNWEHVLAAPEGLIAVATAGRHVYALGYYGHVVYQYDTKTGDRKSVKLGSAGGHVSRNILVDVNEHVYVPRVEEAKRFLPGDRSFSRVGSKVLRSTLVELDTDLKVVQAIPLPDYEPTLDDTSHGITGFATMRDGGVVFTTHTGAFFRIIPTARGPAVVQHLGWFSPMGRSYTGALFAPSGSRYVCGLSRPQGKDFQWVVYDLEIRRAAVRMLDRDSREELRRPGILAYGSNTIDDQGNGYLGGCVARVGEHIPIAWRVRWPEPSPSGGEIATAEGGPYYQFLSRDRMPGVPGVVACYRIGLRESLTVTGAKGASASPAEFRRQAVWGERSIRLLSADSSPGYAVLRRYRKAVTTPSPTPAAGTLEGIDLWLRGRAGTSPEVISLTEGRRLRWEEYQFLAGHAAPSALAALLSEGPMKVGETWDVPQVAIASLIGGVPDPNGTVSVRLDGVTDRPGGEKSAALSVSGRFDNPAGSSAINARAEFVFRPVSDISEPDSPVIKGLGEVRTLTLAQTIQKGVAAAPGAPASVRREVVLERAPADETWAPAMPKKVPEVTPETAWLLYSDPRHRFEISIPHEFSPNRSPTDSPDTVSFSRNRPDGPEILRLNVVPAASAEPAVAAKFWDARWTKERIKPATYPFPETVSGPEWQGLNVSRCDVLLQLPSTRNGPGPQVQFSGYAIRSGENNGILAEAMATPSTAAAFRDEVDKVLQTLRFGQPGANVPITGSSPRP